MQKNVILPRLLSPCWEPLLKIRSFQIPVLERISNPCPEILPTGESGRLKTVRADRPGVPLGCAIAARHRCPVDLAGENPVFIADGWDIDPLEVNIP